MMGGAGKCVSCLSDEARRDLISDLSVKVGSAAHLELKLADCTLSTGPVVVCQALLGILGATERWGEGEGQCRDEVRGRGSAEREKRPPLTSTS